MRISFFPFVAALKSAGARRAALALAVASMASADGAVGQTAPTAATSAPKLSGVYLMQFTSFCQGTLSVTQDGNTKQISVTFNGLDTSQHAGTGNFNSTAGTVAISGWKVSGVPLKVNGGGDTLASAPVSQSAPFSVTSNSVTIGGVAYNAAIGKVTGGIIQSFTFVGLEPDNCSTSGVGIHQ
jgi:hypothetical protein